MNKKAIIHISDLHVMLHTEENGDIIKSELKSMLTTDPDKKVKGDEFLKKIAKHILNNYKDFQLYLIITGDITDHGLEEEYNYAIGFLNLFIKELKLPVDNVLLIPGDHDVNWFDCKTAFFKDDKKKKDFEYIEKYNQFSIFYKKFFKSKDFKKNNTITDVLEFKDEKIVFIGINSNYKIGFKSGYGFVEIENFRSELNLINDKYTNYSKIAVFHSNIIPFFEKKINGQWDENNRNDVIDLLKEFQFKASMFGNEHTSGSKEEGEFYYLEAGSLTMCDTKSQSFKVFEINNEDKELFLSQNLHHLIDIDRNAGNTWSWTKVPISDLTREFKELKEIKLIIKPSEVPKSSTLLEIDEPIVSITKELKPEETTYPYINYLDNQYHHKIFNRVKELKIFHSGHFHWSDNSKAHNWIEVAKLLNDRDDVLVCKKAILDIIEKSKIDFDFIIGLGIEGNILATRTAMVYSNTPYSYLPYSYRYEDHADYEQRLSIKNINEFKKILIITDVVHDGNTIRKLINDKEPEFFKNVEEIYVISLFFSGKDEYKLDLINVTEERKITEKQKGILKYELQPIEERIRFYFVSKMVVETCPYGADFRETCMIVKHKLDCVHEFYDAKNKII